MTNLRSKLPFIALLAFASCAGDCSCEGFTAKDFPAAKYDKTIPTTGSVRLTSNGLDFMEDNLPAIVAGAIPGGLNFCVPEQTGSTPVCYRNSDVCASGERGCEMTLTIDDASITPVPGKTLNMAITLGGLDETISVDLPVVGDCEVRLHSNGNSNLPATVDATIPMIFDVDTQTPTNDVVITTGETVADLGNLDFDIGGGFGCGVANLGFIKNLIRDQLQAQIDPVLSGILDSQLCVSCEMASCPSGSTCNGDGICIQQSGECVPTKLGMEGELEVGATLGDTSEVQDAKVDLFLRVADVAEVDTGLTLGLRNGFDPVSLNGCVPVDPTVRDFTSPPISPTLTGDSKPGGDPYMIGLGYHKTAVEHLLWSVWGSGATCMAINNELLTTSTLGVFLPSLKALAFGEKAEAYIKVVPQTAPQIQLGANTFTEMGTTYEVIDPLMNIDWKDFDLHIFGYVQSRFTRIATIRIDLLLPLALVPTNDGKIIPVLGDIGEAVKNPRVIAGKILAEDEQKLIDIIPTFIGMALPGIADSISDPIELPEFQGFQIVVGPGDITSVDNNTSIALFADLALAVQPLRSELRTSISNVTVNYDARSKNGLVTPQIELFATGFAPAEQFADALLDPERVEFSYRINKGLWSLPHRGRSIPISDPILLIPGKHNIEVKARLRGDYLSEDRTPASFDFIIDYEAPTGELNFKGQTMSLKVSDDLSTKADMQMRFKIIGSADPQWSEWNSIKDIDLSAISAKRVRVEVEVRDSVGNLAELSQSVDLNVEREERTVIAPSVSDGGCSSTQSSPTPTILLFLLAGLFGMRRRVSKTFRKSQSSFWITIIAIAFSLSSCDCSDDEPATGSCDCSDEEMCVEDKCVPKTTSCTEDSECENGTCEDGVCVEESLCEQTCECGDDEIASCTEDGECKCEQACADGCGDGEYCCYDSNSCEPNTDPCDEVVCEAGFETELSGEIVYDSKTCTTPATCTCVPVPPLPVGLHGQYSSVAKSAALTVIADYNMTYGDLMVGITEAGGTTTWSWIDGVPSDGLVKGAADGPREGIITRGDDVGTHTAVALDANDNIHVFYRSEEDDTMKYARGVKSATGFEFTLKDFDSEGDTGYWPSLVSDGDTAYLLYAKKSVDLGGSFESQLVFATVDLASSVDALSVSTEVVASAPTYHPCGEICPDSGLCVLSSGQCEADTNDCPAACDTGQGCRQGSCVDIFVAPINGTPKMIGGYSELSKTDDGFLAVYFDHGADSAAYSIQSGGAWSGPTHLGSGTGPFASGALENDRLHLAFQNRNNKSLEYQFDNGGTELISDGLRDSADWWLVSDVGEDVNLRVKEDGTIVVIYQDAVTHTLHRALRTAPNAWMKSALAESGTPYQGARGFYLTMIKSGSGESFIETYINNQLEVPEGEPVLYE